MRPRDRAITLLNQYGFRFKRSGGKHDIYFNQTTKRIIPLKRHDFDESDLRYIEKEIRKGGLS